MRLRGACLLGHTSTSSYFCWHFRLCVSRGNTGGTYIQYTVYIYIYTFDSNVPDVQPPRSIKAMGEHPAAGFPLQAQTLFRRRADAPQSDTIKCPII